MMITLILFILSQAIYFICNIVFDSLRMKKPSYVIKNEPLKYKKINILVALYNEPKDIILNNFKSQLNSNYPTDLINIYPIIEEKDKQTIQYVNEISAELKGVHLIIVPENGCGDWKNVIKKWKEVPTSGYKGDYNLPFGKGRALTYAYFSDKYQVKDCDVLNVCDAEDIINPNLLKYAISGLEQGYDIVQGKLCYRNKDNNFLSALQSIEPLIWSNMYYPHITHKSVPYQVLGTSYFFDSKLPKIIGGWSPYTTSEDVEFGLRCWENKFKLASLDITTSELGVVRLGDWIKQRRRWARGHQKVFLDKRIKGIMNNFNFFTYSLNSQVMSLISVIGVPIGLFVIFKTLTGSMDDVNIVIKFIILINLIHWIYSSCEVIKLSTKLERFKSIKYKLYYYMRVNPITIMFYSVLWAIPILLAVKDCISSHRGKIIVWEKTSRENCQEIYNMG